MADNKKYYYLKLKENFFDSDALIVLESQPDGYLYSNILLKMYLKSLKNEGRLAFDNLIPYNAEMLAALTRHQVGTVEKALKMFEALGLVEVLENGVIYMTDIQNFIGKSSTEGDRKREYRLRIENEKRLFMDKSQDKTEDKCPDKRPPEIRDKRLDNRDKILDISSTCVDKESKIDYQHIVNLFNSICTSLPKVKKITDWRKKKIKQANQQLDGQFEFFFKRIEQSDFLTGRNGKWTACNFDWIMKAENLVKIIEGTYDNGRNSFEPKKPIRNYDEEF